jgi:putative transposase
MFERNRTRPFLIRYALYLYFLGLSLKYIEDIRAFVDRSYVAIWYWIQEFNPNDVFQNKKKNRIVAFIIDETIGQVGNIDACLWVAIKTIHNRILGVCISTYRNMLVAESFLRSWIKIYGKHIIVYSDGGSCYPEACNSLRLKHILHLPFEKSIIERAIEYIKYRTEDFDDYYPCRKKAADCNLAHVYRWFVLFVFYTIYQNHNLK